MFRKMLKYAVVFPLVALNTAAAQPDSIDVVYKSVDSQGRVSYGDNLAEDAVDFEIIKIERIDDASALAESNLLIEQMATTTERLRRDNREREEARRKAALSVAYPLPVPVYEEPEARYFRGYPYYGPPLRQRRFFHDGHRSRHFFGLRGAFIHNPDKELKARPPLRDRVRPQRTMPKQAPAKRKFDSR